MNEAVPTNPAAGVNVNDPSGLSVSAPWAAVGGVTRTAVSGVPSGSESLASTPGAATTSGVPAVAAYDSPTATGG